MNATPIWHDKRAIWAIVVVGDLAATAAVVLWFTGLRTPDWRAAIPTVAALAVATLFLARRRQRAEPVRQAANSSAPLPPQPKDADGLVEQLLGQGRYALLLRPQIRGSLRPQQGHRAVERMTTEMAPVAAGEVCVMRFDDDRLGRPAELQIAPDLYLDKHTVTNGQYREFVLSGAYADRSLWRPEIWPYVGNFMDSTAQNGPRYWSSGNYAHGDDDLPVVGVSWYEADAYARWAGKRLPGDAEWLKACSSPVRVSEGMVVQRRYPWGDSMDRTKANVWGSHVGKVAPVGSYPTGAALNQVQQMVGNVWEWLLDDFGSPPGTPGSLILPTPMKSIRGGAFDTYFDNQASSQYQSGENPLSRKHNIGFRCALGVRDLSGDASDECSEDESSPDHVEEAPV